MSLVRTASSIVPAQPGWSVLVPSYNDDGKVVDLSPEPVIAWRVRAYSNQPLVRGVPITEVADCLPITAAPREQNLDDAWVLVRPDGRMFSFDGEIPSLDEARAFYEAESEASNAANAPAAVRGGVR